MASEIGRARTGLALERGYQAQARVASARAFILKLIEEVYAGHIRNLDEAVVHLRILLAETLRGEPMNEGSD